MSLASEPSALQQKLRRQELEDYYAKIQKLEAWRRDRASKVKKASARSDYIFGEAGNVGAVSAVGRANKKTLEFFYSQNQNSHSAIKLALREFRF